MMYVSPVLLYLSASTFTYSLFILNGCDPLSWTDTYYPSKIFPTANNSDHCMILPSDSVGSMQIDETDDHDKIIPTLWFDIGSESDVYYNISFNIHCNLISEGSISHFDVMFRVQSLDQRNGFENNKQFGGYSFQANCGQESSTISVKQYPQSKTMDVDDDPNQFDLNSGKIYNIQIIVGDEIERDPRHHKIYINNKLALKFYDSAYLYGGIGISALIADGITRPRRKVSTFYIDDFTANGIGFDDNANDNVECEEIGEIKHINWMDLSRNTSLKPNMNFKMDVNHVELSLYIQIELDYVGYSYCDRLETYGYGTTYVLDFEPFDGHNIGIDKPGTCSNRLSASFQNKSFNNWWNYSLFPYLDDEIGDMNRNLAYSKPSKYWYIYMKHSECKTIVYEAKFNLKDLRDCGNDDKTKKYLGFVNDDEWMNITGTFYAHLVSPMNKDIDIGYYYVYQMLSQPFIISIKKTIDIISSSGISLFTLTFVAVYKQENEFKYSLILLTESTDYLYLTFNQLLDVPNALLQMNEEETECLTLRKNMCSQLFELTAYPLRCANDILSGQYGIRFNIECNQVCTEAIQDNTIDLFLDLQYEDTICDTNIYLIQFNAVMNFYIDDAFSNLQRDTRNGYEIGVDRIYVSIELDFKDSIYDILEAELINVWLCTIDEKYQNEFAVSQSGDNGGCFATDIIDNNQPYHIVQNGAIAVGYDALDTTIYDRDIVEFLSNEVRFSFVIPSDIIRDKLYIHSQVTITLISNTAFSRRILTEEINVQDQVRHFMHHITVAGGTEQQIGDTTNGMYLKIIIFAIIIAVLVAVVIIIFIINKRQRNNQNSRVNQYMTQ